MKKLITHSIASLALAVSLSSCANPGINQRQGTAIGTGVGAGIGAALGQAIGRDQQATLLGAGIGAALGGLAGNQIGQYMDYQEQELQNIMATSNASSLKRSQDVLIATFRGNTYFDFDSSAIKSGGYQELSRIASVLNKYPDTRIQVSGHTDEHGSEQYNQNLSWQRARMVKNVLVQNGVNPARIYATGYGKSQPVSTNDAINRRVEITIIPMS